MSLINTSPTQPTKQEILKSIVNSINHLSTKTYKDLVDVQKRGIDMIWKDSRATPQEIIDALGENAVKAFQFHGMITDLIVDISENEGIDFTPAIPTNAFTISNQGEITIEDEPYIP